MIALRILRMQELGTWPIKNQWLKANTEAHNNEDAAYALQSDLDSLMPERWTERGSGRWLCSALALDTCWVRFKTKQRSALHEDTITKQKERPAPMPAQPCCARRCWWIGHLGLTSTYTGWTRWSSAESAQVISTNREATLKQKNEQETELTGKQLDLLRIKRIRSQTWQMRFNLARIYSPKIRIDINSKKIRS